MVIRLSATRLDFAAARVDAAYLKNYSEVVNAIGNTGTAATIDFSLGNIQTATLNGNCTFSFAGAPATGTSGSITLILTNDSTAGRTTTWPAAVKWPGGTQPSRDSAGSAINIYQFITINAG